MKKLTEIKDHLRNGGDAYWLGNQIAQIDYKSMNLGGKIKIRLSGQQNSIEVDIDEILLTGEKSAQIQSKDVMLKNLIDLLDEKHNGYLSKAITEAMLNPNGIYAKEIRMPGNIEQNVRKYKVLKETFSPNNKTQLEQQTIILNNGPDYSSLKMMEAIIEYSVEHKKVINKSPIIMANDQKRSTVEILSDQAKYLGFGENLNAKIEEKLKQGTPEFSIPVSVSYKVPGQQKVEGQEGTVPKIKQVDFELNFSKSTNPEYDNYFFNSFKATVSEEPNKSRIFGGPSKGLSFTAKEAFNLLEGRAVEKTVHESKDKDGNKLEHPDGKTDWYKLDYTADRKEGQIKMDSYGEKYLTSNKIFDLKELLTKEGINEIKDPEKADQIISSLKKGNAPLVTIKEGDNERKAFITADPQFKKIVKFGMDGKKEFEKKNSVETGKNADKGQGI